MAAPLALQDGESFTYRLSWGLFGRAGELTVTAAAEPTTTGPDRTRITTLTSTRGVIRALYAFDGSAVAVYETNSGRLLEATARTLTPARETHADIVLDYTTAEARYTDHMREERSLTVPIPEGEPADFITTLIQTRTWDLRIGDRRRVAVLFDDEFYELTITAEREETVNTPWGRKPALVLIPRMEENPKGMFRRGGEVRVWVSRDDNRLPLRFEVKLKVGTALAILTGYETRSPDQGAAGAADLSPPP